MDLLISKHFYLACFPVGPVDTFHSLPGTSKHSRVYWSGFAMIILCFKQTPKSVLLRTHTFSCLRICELSRTPSAWLCWVLDYSYVEFRSPLCDFSFWTSDHRGHVFFLLVEDRISRAEQSYAVASEPSTCIMPAQISSTKATRVSRPNITKRGWEDEYLPNNTVFQNKDEKEVSEDHV